MESELPGEDAVEATSVVVTGNNYTSGTGWASHSNPDSAVLKAIVASEKGCSVEPEVTFLMFSNSFATDSVLATLKAHYPRRKFFGWSIVYDSYNFV